MDPGLSYALVAFALVLVVLAGYGMYLVRRARAAGIDEPADPTMPAGSEGDAP